MGLFDFIGRKQRMRSVRPKLAQAAEAGDVDAALESVKPLRTRDEQVYRLLHTMILAENLRGALKVIDSFVT